MVSGSRSVAVQCSLTYEDHLTGLTSVPGEFAFRIYPQAAQLSTEPWRTRSADGSRHALSQLLDPSVDYIVELRVARVGSAIDGLKVEPPNLERWRETEEGLPNQATDPVAGLGPTAAFLELTDVFVDAVTGSVSSVSWTALPYPFNVLVLGDEMADGNVLGADGERRDLGVFESYVWLGLQRAVVQLTPARRLEVMNLSFDENHFSILQFPLELQDGTIVQDLNDFKEGVATRISDGALIERDPKQDYAGHVAALYAMLTLARTHSFNPHMIVIALGAYDQRIQDPSVKTWVTQAAADMTALLTALQGSYFDVPILVITPHTEGLQTPAHADAVVTAMNQGVAARLLQTFPLVTPTVVDFTATQGQEFLEEFVLVDGNGDPALLIGLRGRGTVYSGVTPVETFEVIIAYADRGIVLVALSSTQTTGLTPGSYNYDVELYSEGDAQVYQPLSGTLLVGSV